MNTLAKHALGAAAPLVGALILVSCGGGGGGGSAAGNTTTTGGGAGAVPIGSAGDGARAAEASVDTAYGVATLSVKLSGLAARANAELGTVPVTFVPVTLSCSSRLPILGGSTSTPDSATVYKDPSTGIVSATFNACRSGPTQVDGTATVLQAGGVSNFTLGTASTPLVVTEYADPASTTVQGLFRTSASVTYSQSAPTESLAVTGWVESVDSVRHSHDRFDLAGMSVSIVAGASTIGADAYDDHALTVNGSSTRTAYASDVDPTVRYAEANTFTNFVVAYRTPAAGSAATDDYLGVNGDFSIGTTPPGLCIDGAFQVATVSDVRIAKATGAAVAGRVTINGNAAVTFNADGTVSVSLAGGPPVTYAQADLATMCAI